MARLTEREAWEALADQYETLEGILPGWDWPDGLCGWLWRMWVDGMISAETDGRMARAIHREVKRTGGNESVFIQPEPDERGGIEARVAFCRRMAGK